MPYIRLEVGEVVRVACVTCIKGHRVAECKHFTKVLVQCRGPGRPRENGCMCSGRGIPCECNARTAYTIPGHKPDFTAQPGGRDVIINAQKLDKPFTETITSNPKIRTKTKKAPRKRAEPYPVPIAPRIEHDASSEVNDVDDLKLDDSSHASENEQEPQTKHKSCCRKSVDTSSTNNDAEETHESAHLQRVTPGMGKLSNPSLHASTHGVDTLPTSSNLVATSFKLRADSMKLLGESVDNKIEEPVPKPEYMPLTATFHSTMTANHMPQFLPHYTTHPDSGIGVVNNGYYPIGTNQTPFPSTMMPDQSFISPPFAPQTMTHYAANPDCAMGAVAGFYPVATRQDTGPDGCGCENESTCCCVGCGDHPRNPATMRHVMQAVEHQSTPAWNVYMQSLETGSSNGTAAANANDGIAPHMLAASGLGSQQGFGDMTLTQATGSELGNVFFNDMWYDNTGIPGAVEQGQWGPWMENM